MFSTEPRWGATCRASTRAPRHSRRRGLLRRRLWSQFIAAYGKVVGRTSTNVAPWHVIPADHKWYRNWAVAQIMLDVLSGMHDDYPSPDLDVAALQAQLEPPN